jgi:hypothetical protein
MLSILHINDTMLNGVNNMKDSKRKGRNRDVRQSSRARDQQMRPASRPTIMDRRPMLRELVRTIRYNDQLSFAAAASFASFDSTPFTPSGGGGGSGVSSSCDPSLLSLSFRVGLFWEGLVSLDGNLTSVNKGPPSSSSSSKLRCRSTTRARLSTTPK